MKSIISFVAVCFVSVVATASGPSYYKIDIDINGTAKGKTEAVACEAAKYSIDTEEFALQGVGEYTSSVDCDTDLNEVKQSSCSCTGTDDGYECTYQATMVCLEEVWYP